MAYREYNDYKLETSFEGYPEYVLHTALRYDSDEGDSVEVREKWIHVEELGSGSFGVVSKQKREGKHDATDPTVRAIKRIDKSRMEGILEREVKALEKFSRRKYELQPFFVKFFGWFEDYQSIFLAMEYFPNGTLAHAIKVGLEESDAQRIASQLAKGLKIMHSESFTHRDLKPENIFVVQKGPKWKVKIGDFGTTKHSNQETVLRTTTGTLLYLAPEVQHLDEYSDVESSEYTNAVDVWSFGCVVYQMLAGQVPFPRYPIDLMNFCKGGAFPERLLSGVVSAYGIDFVKTILVSSPKSRPSAEEVSKLPWLRPRYPQGVSQKIGRAQGGGRELNRVAGRENLKFEAFSQSSLPQSSRLLTDRKKGKEAVSFAPVSQKPPMDGDSEDENQRTIRQEPMKSQSRGGRKQCTKEPFPYEERSESTNKRMRDNEMFTGNPSPSVYGDHASPSKTESSAVDNYFQADTTGSPTIVNNTQLPEDAVSGGSDRKDWERDMKDLKAESQNLQEDRRSIESPAQNMQLGPSQTDIVLSDPSVKKFYITIYDIFLSFHLATMVDSDMRISCDIVASGAPAVPEGLRFQTKAGQGRGFRKFWNQTFEICLPPGLTHRRNDMSFLFSVLFETNFMTQKNSSNAPLLSLAKCVPGSYKCDLFHKHGQESLIRTGYLQFEIHLSRRLCFDELRAIPDSKDTDGEGVPPGWRKIEKYSEKSPTGAGTILYKNSHTGLKQLYSPNKRVFRIKQDGEIVESRTAHVWDRVL